MDNRVYAVRCSDYGQSEERLVELVEMMGGMGAFVREGETIALKANLLRAGAPEEAVSTHPAVVSAVARMVKKQGAEPVIVDSPGAGFRFTRKVLTRIYQACGMSEAADESGAGLNFDTTFEVVFFPEGKLIKRFEIITPILKSDGVLNLCKLKSHTFTAMTGAVKNHFGVIPGLAKPGYHAKLMDTSRFANMLLDLMGIVSSRLSIMDAVLAMEGDGPSGGDPREVGLFLGATNPLALDVVAGEIIGLPREMNPVLMEAEKRGMTPTRMNQVELLGSDISGLRCPDFRLPGTLCQGTGFSDHLTWWQRPLQPLFKDSLTQKPRISRKKCTACGACLQACPMKAISMAKYRGKPHALIDEEKCIRCYCCHEMCSDDAVILRRSLLYRFANRQKTCRAKSRSQA
ncbi:MAG: DUF362 domain-containing protein [Deltaproteobacteria bacterium]|nr:DUF362 domain-containing protein [Deltaproteobacteria bacterium]MBW2049563.1 DUF362 domain-containing protein [Deltaproteobacteria bacterium]MBW2111877.1 DUF362 domain-containing protein [Deltaproteobacteria bacterium]